MPGVDLRSAPIRTAIERLRERHGEHLARWVDLYTTLGRALEAATRSDWDGVQLLMAQAESLGISPLEWAARRFQASGLVRVEFG